MTTARCTKDSVRELARHIFLAADHIKAVCLRTLDLRKMTSFTDYLIICSGTSARQVQAIAENIQKEIKEKFKRIPLGIEGMQNAFWVLIDYGDVVCHIFREEARTFYRLEHLWHDAKQVRFRHKGPSGPPFL